MSEILKMIWFDYVSVRKLTVPYVIGFIIVSFLLSLFGIPLGIFCFAAAAVTFAPAQEIAKKDDCRKIYGILPVSRGAVIRTMFIESIGPLITGEIISLLFALISSKSELYRILPERISDVIEGFTHALSEDTGISSGDYCFIIVLVMVYCIILTAFLGMKSEIQKHEKDTVNLLVSVSLTIAVIGIITQLSEREIIPSVWHWLISSSATGKCLLAVILNLAAVGAVVLFCETAVKKTADYEL